MSRIAILMESLKRQPAYTLMRIPARFGIVRDTLNRSRRALHRARLRSHLAALEARMSESVFSGIDCEAFVKTLERDGLAFGLHIPPEIVARIRDYAQTATCYADRESSLGFNLSTREAAQTALGKPILIAQYFNTAQQCAAIELLKNDPLLQWIAAKYIGSIPQFVGTNLWWTFPVAAREEDRFKHAHLFHRDVDCFRFFKFFFYLTDVSPGDGAHVAVVGSHDQPPILQRFDQYKIRRYSDEEINTTYPGESIKEICGDAGTGFAENTLCIHKGMTPTQDPRLLLQFQFAMFDYGVMHDERPSAVLKRVA